MNDIMGFVSENLNNENFELAYVNKNDQNEAIKMYYYY